MDLAKLNLTDLLKQVQAAPAAPAPVAPPKEKRRFLLVGTHAHQTTGYSKVTHNIVQHLEKQPDLEVYHFGFQKFLAAPPDYRPYPPTVQVHDAVAAERDSGAPAEMGFGFSQLAGYVRKVRPHVMLIYNDAGVICKFLDSLTKDLRPEERTYKLIIYLDQVYTIQRPELLARIDRDAHAYFTFTSYWRDVLKRQGIQKPIHVLRHGFDADVFRPLERAAVRRKHGVPEDLFLLLNLNRNTPRKRHDIVVTAFAELVARHPAKRMALMSVCDAGESGGYPLQEIFMRELARLGVSPEPHMGKLMITTTSLTYTDAVINELYSMSDVGITAADGEGFGLCQFEAMGVGVPQIVPYVGGFRDFCKDGVNCRAVAPKWRSYIPLAYSAVGGMIEVVDPHDLAIAAEDYLLDSGLRAAHGAEARKTVLEYVWSEEVAKLARVILDI